MESTVLALVNARMVDGVILTEHVSVCQDIMEHSVNKVMQKTSLQTISGDGQVT